MQRRPKRRGSTPVKSAYAINCAIPLASVPVRPSPRVRRGHRPRARPNYFFRAEEHRSSKAGNFFKEGKVPSTRAGGGSDLFSAKTEAKHSGNRAGGRASRQPPLATPRRFRPLGAGAPGSGSPRGSRPERAPPGPRSSTAAWRSRGRGPPWGTWRRCSPDLWPAAPPTPGWKNPGGSGQR